MTSTRLAVLCAVLLAAPAAAKDIRVAADGTGDYKSLLKALNAAASGDVIIIKKAGGMVGLVLKELDGGIVIEKTVPGSPAEAAGFKPGERVIAVDEVAVAGRGLPEVVGRVRGPVDTDVALKVTAADGTGSRDVTLTRGAVRMPVTDARSKLGIAYGELDWEATTTLAQPLAEGGDEYAQAMMSSAYFHGNHVKKDLRQSFRWAKPAAEAGNVYAMRMLAILYSQPESGQKEPRLAFHWMRSAAEKEDVAAMLNLSGYLEGGYGASKDLSAALDWARRAKKAATDADGQSRSAEAVARLEKLVAASSPDSGATAAKPAAPASPAPVAIRSDVDELPSQRAVDPKAVALVIGVERYREALPKADFAASDAKLAGEYFKRVLGVSEENLAVLVDDRATKSDFEKYIEQWLPNHVEPGSKVYVYYSGHGAPDAAKGDSYLVPFDADPTYIKQTGYSLKRLYANLGKLPAASVTVAMDSCFSGAGGRSVLAKGARPLVNIKTEVLPAKLVVLSASGAAEISNSYQEKGHGLFTYFLLKGLKDKADFRAAYDYLAPEVSRVARRTYNSDQTPQWREAAK